jgi:hypothetical protein
VRGIREEESVRNAVNDAEDKWKRGFDSWEAVTWTAARDPEAGTPLDLDSSLRVLVFDGARSVDMPSVTIIYRFDDDYITVLDASFYDAPHHYAGHG